MMFMSHAMLLCENPAGHPDWPTGTGSKPAASSKLCWGARVEMHSKEPRDGSFVFSNHSMYFAVCAERLHAPMIHKPSHLCLQPGAASKTQGLVGCDSNHVFMIRCCWAHVEQLGHCRSVSFQTPSLQSFESADGRKLPKQRATVVTVAIVCVCESGIEHEILVSLQYAVLTKSTQFSWIGPSKSRCCSVLWLVLLAHAGFVERYWSELTRLKTRPTHTSNNLYCMDYKL